NSGPQAPLALSSSTASAMSSSNATFFSAGAAPTPLVAANVSSPALDPSLTSPTPSSGISSPAGSWRGVTQPSSNTPTSARRMLMDNNAAVSDRAAESYVAAAVVAASTSMVATEQAYGSLLAGEHELLAENCLCALGNSEAQVKGSLRLTN